MELTLPQLFGESATQTVDSLIIKKSDFRGLTVTNNRADQLLAAIILTASRQFFGLLEDEFSRAITDNLGVSIEFDNALLYDQLALAQWKTLVVNNKIQHTFLINQLQVYAD